MHAEHVFTTWARQGDVRPREVTHADGVRFTTADGNEYLDFSSQLVCVNLGHSAERVADAVAEQVRTVPYVKGSYTTERRAELGRKLAELTPGDLVKTFFSSGGATAVEAAIKIAQAYTGKRKVLTRYRSYHGATFGAMTATGDPRRHWAPATMPDVVRAPDAYAYGSSLDPMPSLEYVEEMLTLEGDSIAAVVVEPIVGSSGGVLVPPDGYLTRLQKIAHDHGALLVADEVMTGFGRTGEWFACDHFDLQPDVVTMAKGLSGSYAPLGATTVTREIADYFEDTPFAHGHTFSGHPVACAAGLAAIETYEAEGLVDRAARVGTYLGDRLEALAQDHPSVGDVRGMGLFYGIELSRRADGREPFVGRDEEFSREETVIDRVTSAAAENGLALFARFNTLLIAPPLTISKEDVDVGVSVLDDVLSISDRAMDC